MKKLLLMSIAIGASIMFATETAQANSATKYGQTEVTRNSTGGNNYFCPGNPTKICNTNTLNPDGSHTVIIHLYDDNDKLVGIHIMEYSEDASGQPDPGSGYIHNYTGEQGSIWMKLVGEEYY